MSLCLFTSVKYCYQSSEVNLVEQAPCCPVDSPLRPAGMAVTESRTAAGSLQRSGQI